MIFLSFFNRNASGVYEMSISQQNHLHVVMRVLNEGEPAYLTRIYINKPQVFTYLGTEQQVEFQLCRIVVLSNWYLLPSAITMI